MYCYCVWGLVIVFVLDIECYVGRRKSHEAVHTGLDRPLDILLYNFTTSYDGLQWTLYIEYVTVSDIIVIY